MFKYVVAFLALVAAASAASLSIATYPSSDCSGTPDSTVSASGFTMGAWCRLPAACSVCVVAAVACTLSCGLHVELAVHVHRPRVAGLVSCEAGCLTLRRSPAAAARA